MKNIPVAIYLIFLFCINASAQGADKVVVIPLFDSASSNPEKLIFATDGTWNGNLGGLAGADEKCKAEASLRGIPGTFQALLGSSEAFPLSRSIHHEAPYMSITNAQLKFDFHKLFSNSGIENPVSSGGVTWTGLMANGGPSQNNCLNWSNSTVAHSGTVGKTDSTGNGAWLEDDVLQCDELLSLYCVEQ